MAWIQFSSRCVNRETKPTYLFTPLNSLFCDGIFTAALAHQYAPEIKVIEGLKETFLAGGMIGKSMHEIVFYELFGGASTIIYVCIIFVSFSIATSASWKNISKTMFSTNKTFNTVSKSQTAPIKPSPNISSIQKLKPKEKAIKSKDTKKTKKADKAEKPQKAESSNLYKATTSSGLPGLSLLDDVDNSGLGYSEEFLEEMSKHVSYTHLTLPTTPYV